MARDYKKEWEEIKYKRMVAKIDKDLAREFLEKLDKPYAVWLREQIENYLKNKSSLFLLWIFINFLPYFFNTHSNILKNQFFISIYIFYALTNK